MTVHRAPRSIETPIELLIADDHEFIRRGLIRILANSHPEWHVVADVPTGTAAIELGAALRPGVAILDLSMPDIGGLQAAERLLELVPGIRIVILSMYAAAPILRHLRKAGVSAYLARNEAPKMLVYAVERVLAGKPFFASSSVSRQTVEAPENIPVQFLLTSRELDALHLLARRKSNKELAFELDTSVRTAESHHANIVAKLNIQSLGDLVRIAFRDGVT
jgi:DNA-binding NarL/FixJ family response regulator